MKYFFTRYQDWILVFIAALLLGGIVGFYAWGTNVLFVDMTRAIGSEASTPPAVEFHIGDAEKILGARGLLP